MAKKLIAGFVAVLASMATIMPASAWGCWPFGMFGPWGLFGPFGLFGPWGLFGPCGLFGLSCW
jgi:hypothetical protein